MTTLLRNFWQTLTGRSSHEPQVIPASQAVLSRPPASLGIEIRPDDPLITYFQTIPSAVETATLNLDSPALRALQAAGVKLVVPLVSQGELIGLLNLGDRLSEQDYSTEDRRLLDHLATQAAPAVRVAQLVRQQQVEARERERLEQELRVARVIQQTLLPKELPMLVGWQVAAYYQPAQEIGGDFYDFLYFPDGRVGFVIGDVTDKGIPAALVMAATRTLLRTVAQRLVSPGQVLERVNDLLCPDIPPKMFVTCLYALLNPSSGHLQYANAGHNLPCLRTISGIIELRATGMPLGLMPGMRYEEKDVTISSNESVLFYTDGLVEAHNSADDMFSGSRLRKLVVDYPASGAALIDFLLAELTRFTGADWEQEDDVTLVTLERVPSPPTPLPGRERGVRGEDEWRTLADFSVASQPGNEREAIEAVIQAVQEFHLSKTCLERLSTAVAEATMNAIEHGNKNRPEAPVQIQVLASETTLSVRITDQGGGQPIPDPEIPNLEAKLAGLQTPRGWGLFLIKNLMDDLVITGDESHHTLELILHLEGGKYICQPDSSR